MTHKARQMKLEELVRYTIPQRRQTSWPSYLDPYADVFSEESFEKLPKHRPWDHVIDLKPVMNVFNFFIPYYIITPFTSSFT